MAERRDQESRVYALLGHPVHHSLSPRMQNAAFQAAGARAAYVALDVPPDRLEEVLRGLHAAGVFGLNLTAPHKEAAWPLLCGATEEAGRVRAVNTLRREATGWFGHATDGLGFRDWISSIGVNVAGARVLLLGAGGAARSIVPVLASLSPRSIGVVSRDSGRARDLVDALRQSSTAPAELEAAALDDRARSESLPRWDLLIRALATDSVEGPERGWWERLTAEAPALDLNYGARAAATKALATAEGRRFEDGLGLLLCQGALSYEFWTAERAPLEAMKKALAEATG